MKVELVPHDPGWAERFEREAERIREALGRVAVRIEHVGSTAVLGIVAKPVIDIQVSVVALDPWATYGEQLTRLGYEYRVDDELEHRFFRRDEDGRRAFHVHVCESGGGWERRHLAFRDALRSDPELRSRYETLKRTLAGRFPEDSLSYAEAKTPFMNEWETSVGL